MLAILKGPFGAGWKEYLWKKAQKLSEQPIYTDLPEQLTAAMRPVETKKK